MKGKGLIIIIGIILLVVIAKACGWTEQEEIDEVGSSIDWGRRTLLGFKHTSSRGHHLVKEKCLSEKVIATICR